MSSLYYIRGEDGEEYGPIEREELLSWVKEDRVGPGTPVRLEEGPWKRWENFVELIPQGTEVIAPFSLRLMAFIVDNVIFVLMMTFAVTIVWGGIPTTEIQSWEQCMNLLKSGIWNEINEVLQVVTLIVHLTYFIVCHGRWGRTPGKAIFGLRVVQLDGTKLTWRSAFFRGIASIFSTSFFYLGYAIAIFSPGIRTLHDWLSGTKVIRS